MAIKWSRWTRRRPVKITCVVLIVVMAFVFAFSAVTFVLSDHNWRFSPVEVLFGSLESRFFLDGPHAWAIREVADAFRWESPERIREQAFLEWQRSDNYGWHGYEEEWYDLMLTGFPHDTWVIGSLPAS